MRPDAPLDVRERRVRRRGERRGWTLYKLRVYGSYKPWRVTGGPEAVTGVALSLDELEQALGIDP